MHIGHSQLSGLARQQVEDARRDPRLGRGRGAPLPDYRAAVAEAERLRALTVGGLHELAHSLERAERDLGVHRDDPDLSPEQRAELQAAWERSELAQAEIANDYPYIHAMALVSLQSALDALVEELVPELRRVDWALQAIEVAKTREPEAWEGIPDEVRSRIFEALLRDLAPQRLEEGAKPKGGGAKRYEDVLALAGLQAPPGRCAIPDDMDEALRELNALRNVLVHQGGRIDEQARLNAPTLPYALGEFVRVSREDYRCYSAAAHAYGEEVLRRVHGSSAPDVNLRRWRDYHEINA